MGDQWAAKPEPSQQFQTAGGTPVDANATMPNGQQAPGVGGYRNPINVTPAPDSGTANGQVQPVGTGLQRARDLSNAMVSNATGSQKAAQDALDQYKKEIVLNRKKFYTDAAEAWVGLIMGMMV
jgi:ABC-type glycerol-3-phosphate transport system substrate-binding protein